MSEEQQHIRQRNLKRPLATYSKRHAKRLRKEQRLAELNPSISHHLEYSTFSSELGCTFSSSGDFLSARSTPDRENSVVESSWISLPSSILSSSDRSVEMKQVDCNPSISSNLEFCEEASSVSNDSHPSSVVHDDSAGNSTSTSASSKISLSQITGSSIPANLSSVLEDISCLAGVESSGSSSDTIDTSTADGKKQFKTELQIICVERNITHAAINAILLLLRKLLLLSFLPKDARTLLKTLRNVNKKPLSDDEDYVHIGLEEVLRLYYTVIGPVDVFKIYIGIDGLPISGSSSSHFWPIMCAVVPPDPYEPSFVSAVGIWHGQKTKPSDANKFLKMFVMEARQVLTDGVKVDGKIIKVELLGLTFDAPAKSQLLGTIGHSGYDACPRCKIEGVQAHGVHFPGVGFNPRSHEEFLPGYLSYLRDNLVDDQYRQAYSLLEKLPGVDLVNDVVLDQMHILCQGVAKYILKIFTGGKSSLSDKLSADKILKVNKRIMKMRKGLPREFARKVKSINMCGSWKATQCRQFILYTGAVTLFKILPEKQYDNYLRLHAATYIMFHPVLREKYLHKARSFLKKFTLDFAKLYGDHRVTLNLHLLQHLPDDVARFGDLNRSSAFQFENFLGPLGRLVRKGHLPLPQAVKRLAEKACAALAKKTLLNNQPNTRRTGTVTFSQEHKSGPLVGEVPRQYRLAEFHNKFTLRASNETIKDNCCVIANNEIIVIENFVISSTGEKCMLFKRFLNKGDFYRKPIRSSKLGIYQVDSLSQKLECLPVSAVQNKCALIKRGRSFVAFPLLHGCQ